MKKLVILSTVIFLFISCRFNSSFTNNPADKKDAEVITNQLFELLKQKKYDSTTALFSKRFFAATTKERLFEIFKATHVKLGNLEKTELEAWETKRVEGSDPSANYALQYNNTYKKYMATETIRLTREKDGSIKIVAYNINSEGFLKLE